MPSFVYEKKLARKGFKLPAGVDEAGRGPLAGPIVAAAVIFPLNCSIQGLDDSKKLTPRKREKLFIEIKKQALGVGVSMISHHEIDRLNIEKANRLVMRKAVEELKIVPDFVLVDGRSRIPGLNIPQRAIIGGDGKCNSIAAASIIAKVTRDRLMVKYHARHPQYGFNRHKGYATKEHLLKLSVHGPCPIHRRSFAYVT
jgi:ribonuclease HII